MVTSPLPGPTPALSLPPEILVIIFALLVRDSGRDFLSTGWLDRLKITSVCRQWRTAALDIPEFWSSISLNPGQGIEELIARSKDRPLSIRLHLSSQHKSWNAISQYHATILAAERLGEFHLHTHHVVFPWVLFPKIHAPVLRSLKLSMSPSIPTPLPSHVLAASKPVLPHLSLKCCEVD